MAPKIFFHIFSIFLKNYLMKKPQTTNTLTFLTHIILAIGGVISFHPRQYVVIREPTTDALA